MNKLHSNSLENNYYLHKYINKCSRVTSVAYLYRIFRDEITGKVPLYTLPGTEYARSIVRGSDLQKVLNKYRVNAQKVMEKSSGLNTIMLSLGVRIQ